MKEFPILFSREMTRAILGGRKTMTRRIVKPQPALTPEMDSEAGVAEFYDRDECVGSIRCPHGKPGDTLWVRETWAHVPTRDAANHVKWHGTLYTPRNCIYRADDPKLPPLRWGKEGFEPFKWAPSIFMPRWASRITLRIKSVRVERLQDISEDDARAEGAPFELAEIDSVRLGATSSHRAGFRRLWDSLNAKRGAGWDTNPLVWVISFERVEPGLMGRIEEQE